MCKCLSLIKLIYNLAVVIKSEIEIQDDGTRSSEEAASEQTPSSEFQSEKVSLKSALLCDKTLLDASVNKYGKKISVPKEERMKNACHMPIVTNSRKRCAVCSTHSKESRTKFMCKTCKVGLCLKMGNNCFELFHAE